jgi:type II secretory pathway predicted ATPase ExeA
VIRAHFGIDKEPFSREGVSLLAAQQDIFDTLRVHCQQGGLCLVVGDPGTGKSVLKEHLCLHDTKRLITPVVNRTLHTYTGTLRILCDALDALRKLRLLLEDFPKNHNLILIAQPELLGRLALSVNEDIKSRVTYSATMPKLAPDDIEAFIKDQLDRVALAHSTFTPEAMALIARSSEGALRSTKNLCIGAMLEAVRDRTRTVDLKQVNRVLLQPHWRRREDMIA